MATVRQARLGSSPDPVEAAQACEDAGADSIVCHLREDRRHIQDRDVDRLVTQLTVPLNLEMSIAHDIVNVALRLRPHQVTLVPERRRELTTEGGLDVVRCRGRLARLIPRFARAGIRVSLFVDPTPAQLAASAEVGAQLIELHTGRYASAKSASARAHELEAVRRATRQARRLGLAVAAGHGLDYRNTPAIAAIPDIEEVNIGFAIVARAMGVGMAEAVREMKALLRPLDAPRPKAGLARDVAPDASRGRPERGEAESRDDGGDATLPRRGGAPRA